MSKLNAVLLALSLVLSTLVPVAAAAASTDPSVQWDPGPGVVHHETGEAGEARYIVRHQAPAVAAYEGGLADLAGTANSVTGASRLDVSTPRSVAYRDFLAQAHDDLLAVTEAAIGRAPEVAFRYDTAFNGLALELTPAEAEAVAGLPGVARIERETFRELMTDNGPAWIGADAIHDGSGTPTGAAGATLGEGVVVGIIDTGINHDHPSFAEVGPVDGYVHTNPRSFFYGLCDPVTGAPLCNDKLIGAYDFTGTTPEDDHSHGSHTASTSAGNVVDMVLEAPTITLTRRASGVAPHANIISYKGCSGTPVGCPLSALVAAINQATIDGVDVINYSIGSSASSAPWLDPDGLAFLNANAAGIFVATSAGNDGPGADTVGSPAEAPWVTTVGASTHDRAMANAVIDMTRGGVAGPANIAGKSLTAALPSATIVYAGDYAAQSTDPANAHKCGSGPANAATGEGTQDPWPAGTFTADTIVVCDRGDYGRVAKAEYVKRAGAGGFVLANDEANGNSLVGDAYPIPGVHISYDDGVILKAWLAEAGVETAAIRGSNPEEDPALGDVMAGFSSRGKNRAVPSIIKPDVTAPGVDILAAYMTPAGSLGGNPEYGPMSGTSMSSPHAAGAGALIRAVHPDWTPDEVKSAMMTTSFNAAVAADGDEVHPVMKEDGATLSDPFDRGAGRVDLHDATRTGFVMDVGRAAYDAADPSSGGDPRTLNIASFGDDACDGLCSWTRTVDSVVTSDVIYTPTFDAPAGLTLSISPSTLTVPAGGSASFTVTANVADATSNDWHFGTVVLTPDIAGVATASFPVAVRPTGEDIVPPVPTTALHIHGNVHDGCTGSGVGDLIACDGPWMSPDPALDSAPAARFTAPSALGGTNPRTIYDISVEWDVDSPAVVEGPMDLDVWLSCSGCGAAFNADWTVRVFDTDAAGAVAVHTERLSGTPLAPNVPTLIELTTVLPRIEIAETMVLHVEPVFIDSQAQGTLWYDSQQPCGGPDAEGETRPCDSVVHLPIVSGGVNPPPPPSSEVVLHFHGNVHDGCTGDGAADFNACDGPTLEESDVLDPSAPAARFADNPLLINTGARGPADPNWVWRPAEATTVKGPMTVSWWSQCASPSCNLLEEEWDITLYADGSVAQTFHVATPPRLTDATVLNEVVLDVAPFSVNAEMVLEIESFYTDQQPMTILYDSVAPCGAEAVPCDSTVAFSVAIAGNVAPIAADDFPPAVQAGSSVDVDVLLNDSDPNGDAIELVSFTQPTRGTVSPAGDSVLRYTHDGSTTDADSFTYTITDGEFEATATVHVRIAGAVLELENSFVTALGWVKPGETYPFRIIVTNPTPQTATGAAVTVAPPAGAFFTQVTTNVGSAEVVGSVIQWSPGDIAPGTTVTLVGEGRAATFNEDPRIVWKDLSSHATLTYDQLPDDALSDASHGPKVIPPTGGYETARYGDRPFPVVPVDYQDRKHKPHHDGASIDAKINSPAVPGSTFNLFQEMSLGQLFPDGTVPSSDIESADHSSYEHGWHFSQLQPQGACTGVTLGEAAGTPLYDERIVDGWYQLPGTTGYYGADRYTTGGPVVGGETGVGALFQIDDACGPIGKAVYDAAHIADPEIDYSEYDTDKDGVVDFFMMLFVGCGGNGESQKVGGECDDPEAYDNIWPHSSSLEFYYSDENGLKGYVSDDQLRSLEDVPQCYLNASYTAFDDCAAAGGSGVDALPVYVRVGPYNVNPEAAIDNASVISHEYGHSLGLPDFYSRGGRDTYGDWNLMATDKGHHMDVFGKQEMGWVVPVPLQPGTSPNVENWRDSKVDTGEIHWVTPDGVPYTLSAANGDQNVHNAEAYVAKLPGRILLDPAKVANGASAPSVWWSGSGNDFGCAPTQGHNLDVYLPDLANYAPGDTIELEFASMYEIEWDYDYGFVMASTDGGNSYQALPSMEGTTTPAAQNPYANSCQAQYGNGITGTSESVANGTVALDRATDTYEPTTQFITDRFDLSQFAGQPTVLRFSYATDPGLAKQGWFIDDVKITVNGTEVVYESSFDDSHEERLFPGGCTAHGAVSSTCTAGWNFVDTTAGSPADHAYYLEMRDRSGFDVDGKGENDRAPIAFDPGVLLVYTDEAHGYGNTGADNQPAQTPVDANPVAGDETPNLNDAAFRIDRVTHYSDAAPLGWLDNYDDGSGEWRHIFDCLSFDVTRMTGHTTKVLDFDLEGDVSFTLGDGCVEFDYGIGEIENRAPTAVATAKPATAGVGETVTLDGSASSDDLTPASDLTYEWDVDGNGTTDLTGQTTSTSFATAGIHVVTLTVTDAGGLSATDEVTVTVTEANGRPDAVDDAYETDQDTVLTVPAPGVLGNDTDPDGDDLTATVDGEPAHGTVTVNEDGSFTYEPDPGYSGDDAFTYRASDGSLDDGAVVRITVHDASLPACPQGVDEDDDGEATPVEGDTSGCSDGDVRAAAHLEFEEPDGKGKVRTRKINVKFDARSDATYGIRGGLELDDRARNVSIDAPVITSLEPGDGADCNGTVLSGSGAFLLTAEGTITAGGSTSDATFHVCGQDNGQPHNGGSAAGQDVLYVTCASGCSYTTDHPASDDRLDGGNVFVRRAVTAPAGGAADTTSDGESAEASGTSDPAAAPQGDAGGAGDKSTSSGAQVVELGPMLLGGVEAFSLQTLDVRVYDAHGLMDGETVVLTWLTDAGVAGSTTVITDALGAATATVVVPVGAVEYVATVGGLASNGVTLTGVPTGFLL